MRVPFIGLKETCCTVLITTCQWLEGDNGICTQLKWICLIPQRTCDNLPLLAIFIRFWAKKKIYNEGSHLMRKLVTQLTWQLDFINIEAQSKDYMVRVIKRLERGQSPKLFNASYSTISHWETYYVAQVPERHPIPPQKKKKGSLMLERFDICWLQVSLHGNSGPFTTLDDGHLLRTNRSFIAQRGHSSASSRQPLMDNHTLCCMAKSTSSCVPAYLAASPLLCLMSRWSVRKVKRLKCEGQSPSVQSAHLDPLEAQRGTCVRPFDVSTRQGDCLHF